MSRVGGSAQIKAMKQVAGTLRLSLAQYRELAAFAQFASDLDKATQNMLSRGARLVEVLKQPQYSPMAVEQQVMVIYGATNGWLDEYPVARVQEWHDGFLSFIADKHPEVAKKIVDVGKMTDDVSADLDAALAEYKGIFAG